MESKHQTKELGRILENLDRLRVPVTAKDREPGPFPYYGAAGIQDWVSDFIFEGRHLLVAEDGSVETKSGGLVLQLVDGQFWVNNHAHVLRAQTESDTRFVYYALHTVPARPFMTGAVQQKISQKNLNRIKIPFPDEATRGRIAAVLGALDDKIELNRKMNRTLEQIAQAIFKSWFIDFDGHDDLVDSGVGPIPMGWEIGSVAEVADLNPAVWRKPTAPTTIRYMDLKNLKWGTFGDYLEYPYEEAPSRARRVLEHGDTLIGTVRPDNGSYGLVLNPPENATGSTGFAVLRPREVSSTFFLYLWLTRKEFISHLASVAHGSAYPAVAANVIHEAAMAVPPADLMGRFDETVRPMMEKIAANEQQSATLADVRDALLPKLLSGELRVPESLDDALELAS